MNKNSKPQKLTLWDSFKTNVSFIFTFPFVQWPLSILYIALTGLIMGFFGIISCNVILMIAGVIELVGVLCCLMKHLPTMAIYLCIQSFNCVSILAAFIFCAFVVLYPKQFETISQLQVRKIAFVSDPRFLRVLLVLIVLFLSRAIATGYSISLIYKKKILEKNINSRSVVDKV